MGVGLASATLLGVGACADSQTVTENAYCADANGVIVSEDHCDTSYYGNPAYPYYIWHGNYGSNLRPGYRLTGGSHFPYNDTSQRSALGLPKTGPIATKGGFGTTITRSVSKGASFGGTHGDGTSGHGSTGGFGSGGHGSSGG